MPQSPIDESQVTRVPPPSKPRPEENEWEKLGKASGFPKLNDWFEQQKEALRRSLPAKDADKKVAWDNAVWGITFIESIQTAIAKNTKR